MAYDNSGYERSRRGIETQYTANTATNDYARSISQQRGNRRKADHQNNFKSGWGRNASAWGAKGHTGSGIKSGFYQQAIGEYASDYQRDRTRLYQDLQEEQYQFTLAQQRLDAEKQNALAELEAKKRMEIALLAENIQAVAPGIG
jgi:hypothetical protein